MLLDAATKAAREAKRTIKQAQIAELTATFNLLGYDRYVVAFSGGKDSLALVLALLEAGVAPAQIELHHHDIDGQGQAFMDWQSTPAYCRAVAAALGVAIFFSWKEGGFEGEMLREDALTAPTRFELAPQGETQAIGGVRGERTTRLQYPQVTSDLKIRWCSPYLKIDVLAKVITHSPRFQHCRTLVLTGERAAESAARRGYAFVERYRADARDGRDRREVDQCRLVHAWTESQVWAIIQRWGILPHPAYRLGWGRLSCMTCIFGSPNQWATIRALYPARFERVSEYEQLFGKTIQRTRSIVELAARGTPYPAALAQPELARLADSPDWDEPVRVDPDAWTMPAGAFGESAGPT